MIRDYLDGAELRDLGTGGLTIYFLNRVRVSRGSNSLEWPWEISPEFSC